MPKQPGLFDLANRHAKLLKTKDFLERINLYVNWELFRPILDAALERKSLGKGGRPPYDAMLLFKILVIQALYNLSDEQTEYQILDRLSFMRFLGLEMHHNVPDARTIWLFRETLRHAQAVEKLFAIFDDMLNKAGFAASGGQIIDATFVEVPRQRNNHDENDRIKGGEKPREWSKKKSAHKDTDAKWTKKDGINHYGYKNHVNVDAKNKIIRTYKVTNASVHDSQEIQNIIYKNSIDREIWADSAYHSAECDKWLHSAGYTSKIQQRGYRGHPLSDQQKIENTEKSRIRVRVEHVFAHMETAMRGKMVRTIGIARVNVKIGLKNLAYNISRFVFLVESRA